MTDAVLQTCMGRTVKRNDWSDLFPADDQLDRHEVRKIKTILRKLFGIGVHTFNRTEVMLSELADLDWRTFFPVLQETWPSCDSAFRHRAWVLESMRTVHAERDWVPPAIRVLPELVPVFRGCAVERVRHVSWTLERSVAETFARGHRGIQTPYPVLASAVIPREHVFAYIEDRDEAAVILEPKRLRKLKIEPWDGMIDGKSADVI